MSYGSIYVRAQIWLKKTHTHTYGEVHARVLNKFFFFLFGGGGKMRMQNLANLCLIGRAKRQKQKAFSVFGLSIPHLTQTPYSI